MHKRIGVIKTDGLKSAGFFKPVHSDRHPKNFA